MAACGEDGIQGDVRLWKLPVSPMPDDRGAAIAEMSNVGCKVALLSLSLLLCAASSTCSKSLHSQHVKIMSIFQGSALWIPFQSTLSDTTSLPLTTFALASGALVNDDFSPLFDYWWGLLYLSPCSIDQF